MKISLTVLTAVVLCLGVSGVSFAQAQATSGAKPAVVTGARSPAGTDVIKGKVIAIDNAKNEVTVQQKNGAEKVIIASAKQIASLKTGDSVKVTLKEGSANAAKSIKVITNKKLKKS